MEETYDVIVVGGGQSGLAVGYHLRKTDLKYLILDRETLSGGSWQHYWQSLRLFSPASFSSLPGTLMLGGADYYPSRDETLEYLRMYEKKYKLNVQRSVTVEAVARERNLYRLVTNQGTFWSKTVVSATGSFAKPFIPEISGMENFEGEILHSAAYQKPAPFKDKQVVIVGEGNSGAQILAEVSQYARTTWLTAKAPSFLPDEVDGRVLFDRASALYEAKKQGKNFQPPSLGDIVMVPSVKEARARGALKAKPAIAHFEKNGVVLKNGEFVAAEMVIFCTGFRPALDHLKPLNILEKDGRVHTENTKAEKIAGLWLVGYGSWTGFASATLIGVGRSARQTVEEIRQYVSSR
ncbi:ArsO family NAD(P)H-dependent flavin-containing monooxygenase [Catalinimonas niigatensis]|uniref:ArsO family NAD(P)H-dependent flavin-containing monooxygenase n=1 Tax=Catalinimonas niigatensis TaxID=1397264 RepID=UPI002666318D|nr:ArsO family NAD(P)H-dependent flavin-containing monooxygenase [Catalinimonas niigatensis]WPP48026.1 ArsO family NAD(P)H-dependent flavin-containing monooxygenase [Catalinimonas niigatensis]